jgi:O-antigen/teichoic acid export membrane protein
MINSFGKKKLIRDISANTVQTGITQVFGLILFYLTSRYLSKHDFGEFNWSIAVGSTIIAIASLGLDLVFVKRIARGDNVIVMSGIHFFHTVVVGIGLSILVFVMKFFTPSFTGDHPVFFYVFLNLALANMANSFKLCLNGLEAYKKLAQLAVFSNVSKFLLIVFIYVTNRFSLYNVLFSYIAASVLEFGIGYFMMNRSLQTTVRPVLKTFEYKYFILESLPQLGVVLFDSALARIDWILLGIISTPGIATTAAGITAEYSFAYKVFELSKLPLLVISPILLTRLSRLMNKENGIGEKQKKEIGVYFKLELFLVMLIPIFLITTWTPLMDFITDGKYGAVNEHIYWILSACVPLLTVVNFLWTIGFVQGQLKEIMFITIGASVINIGLNIVLIPWYNATGAAIAFLISTIIQAILYWRFIKQDQVKINLTTLLFVMLAAALSVIITKILGFPAVTTMVVALGIYISIAFLSRQVSFKLVGNLGKGNDQELN